MSPFTDPFTKYLLTNSMPFAVNVKAPAVSHSAKFNVYTASIKEISDQLAKGSITSGEILDIYLQQIKRHNGRLRALIHTAPENRLIQIAAERDEERAAGKTRGVLHGIPVVVK